jgi:hypothetical protein
MAGEMMKPSSNKRFSTCNKTLQKQPIHILRRCTYICILAQSKTLEQRTLAELVRRRRTPEFWESRTYAEAGCAGVCCLLTLPTGSWGHTTTHDKHRLLGRACCRLVPTSRMSTQNPTSTPSSPAEYSYVVPMTPGCTSITGQSWRKPTGQKKR